MSDSASFVDARLVEYLAAHVRGDDEFLRELKSAARAAGLPPIWIAPEQAALLAVLLGAIGAREVLEIGTLAGYAAIRMARALPPGGRLRTLEWSARNAAFARGWISRSDVAQRIEVLEGDARVLLRGIESGTIDACFVDADKTSYPTYLAESERLLRRGGLLLVDNAFAFGQLLDEHPSDREAPALQAFNELLARSSAFESALVPLGDGLWVARRL